MKEIFKKALLILCSTVISLDLCEIGVRILGYKFTGSTYTADPLLGWALRPGAGAWEADEGVAWSRINSHGYRDRERSVSKPPGCYRVAVLGDSMTEARQVEMDETFTALAEEELNRRPCFHDRKVEVLNFGVPGDGTAQELLQLRERVWPFSPDLLVLQVYPGNDIFNNYRALNISTPDLAPYFLLRDGKLELDDRFRQGSAFNPTRVKIKGMAADALNRSVLLEMAYKLCRMRGQRGELSRLEKVAEADPNAPPPEYQRFLAFQSPAIAPMVEAWRVTEALITEFGRETRSHGVPLLILVMPAGIQIEFDRGKREEFRRAYKIDSLEYADERVERCARANEIPVLLLAKPLLDEATRTGAYMAGFANTAPNAGHLNERGHRVVARELFQAICEMAGK